MEDEVIVDDQYVVEEEELEIVVDDEETTVEEPPPKALTTDDIAKVVKDAMATIPKDEPPAFDDDDWEKKLRGDAANDALKAMQELQRLQRSVESKAIAMLGDLSDDPEAVAYVREQVAGADPANLVFAEKDPSSIQGVVDQYLGRRFREGRPLVAKNTSQGAPRQTTGRNQVVMSKELKEEYDRYENGVLAGFPAEQKKAALKRWRDARGIK